MSHKIFRFTGAGIALYEHAAHNVIGGERDIGSGPVGQGNLIVRNFLIKDYPIILRLVD